MCIILYIGGFMRKILDRSFKYINKKYKEIISLSKKNTKVTGAYEWLADNYYIIEEDVHFLREELKHVSPKEVRGFRKDAYILLLARKFLKKNEYKLTIQSLVKFLNREQEKNPLRIAELWLFPSALKIAIIIEIAGISVNGKNSVKMGNLIKSLISVRDLNWKERFDELSLTDKILSLDNVYPLMSFETKTMYRKAVTRVANISGCSEYRVAKTAIKCTEGKEGREEHVGYYLLDEGEKKLFDLLGTKKHKKIFLWLFYVPLATVLSTVISFFIKHITGSIIGTAIANILIFDIILTVLGHIALKVIPQRRAVRMELKDGIPEDSKTLIVYPVLLSSVKQAEEMADKVEVCFTANKQDNLFFAILGDFKDNDTQKSPDDEKIISAASDKIKKLNNKYGDRFFLLHRERMYSKKQNKWMGRERKRGALADLNSFLRKKYSFKFTQGRVDLLYECKYVITLDSDTFLPIDGAKKLVGTMLHPLNKPEFSNGTIKKGYAMAEPRVGLELVSANKTLFSGVYGGQGGIDTYSSTVSDIYMDMFGEAVFTGKGIYDIDAFIKCTENAIPNDTVLSHDLLEGNYCRCALTSDVEVYDGFPSKFLSYVSRMHRWIRGDWQILWWLLPKVKDKDGNLIKNPLSILSKWKILDNLRRSLIPVIQVLLILFAGLSHANWILWTGIAFLSLAMPMILYFCDALLAKGFMFIGEKVSSNVYYGARGYLYQLTLKIIFLPYTAYMSTDAIIRGIARSITKRKTLEWVTADDKDKETGDGLKFHYIKMFPSVIIGILCVVLTKFTAMEYIGQSIILCVIWAAAPLIACYSGYALNDGEYKITEDNRHTLMEIAERIWRFFDRLMNEGDNFLPPDNIQIQPYKGVAHRTSPTNIGLGMVAIICARDLGFLSNEEAALRLEKTLDTIEKLEKWQGHLYNWYNTRTLAPLKPRYISTVDSGNFVCYLMVTAKAIEKEYPEIKCRILNLVDATHFKPLYDENKELFSIGYSVDENRLTNSYYDLLASEARQAGFLSIARGEIKPKHWFRLGRTLTHSGGYKGLVSWTGTMFEYLMPLLIMKRYKKTLFDETYWFVMESQKKFAKKRRVPWGVSESGYYSFDMDRNYQYKAFGIPRLAIKRGQDEDIVITPYATFLGLMADTKSALLNIEHLKKEGLYGEYGMYEAVDYNPDVSFGLKKAVVKSYMAHHQGMSLAAITNVLTNNVLQDYFHSYPSVKAAEPLLKERVPVNVLLIKEYREKVNPVKYKWQSTEECVRKYENKYLLPPVHLLSNGSYSVMVDNTGNGYSELDKIMLNKFSLPGTGQMIYVKCVEDDILWDGYGDKCVFSPHIAEFHGEKNNIDTNLSIHVSPYDNAEIRRMTLVNKSGDKKTFEVYFFTEISLTSNRAQIAHNAFANLFVQTKYEEGALYAMRRKRDENEKTFVGFSFPVIESKSSATIQFETNRESFIGRGRSAENAKAFYDGNAFTSGVGNVLDPCFAFKVTLSIENGESASVSFINGLAENYDNAQYLVAKYKNISFSDTVEEAYRISKNESGRFELKEGEEKTFLNALTHIIYGGNATGERERCILENTLSYKEIWKNGISGDLPVITLKISAEEDIPVLEEMIRAHAYWRHKDIYTDLVIICNEPVGYTSPLAETVNKKIGSGKNGIYLITGELSDKDKEFFCAISKIYVDAAKGGLSKAIQNIPLHNEKKKTFNRENQDGVFGGNLDFYNGYGGFDGEEYVIDMKRAGETPAPWVNVIANDNIGFIAGESGGGYTWYKNSHQQRITSWNNDAVTDEITEKIFIEESDDIFSPLAGVFYEEGNYRTMHGFGYTKYLRKTRNLNLETTYFVPEDDSVKIINLKIKNNREKECGLKVCFSVVPVLGVNLYETRGKKRYFSLKNGAVGAQNAFTGDEKTMFVSSCGKTECELKERNSGIKKGSTGAGFDAEITVYEKINLMPDEEKTISFILGASNTKDECNKLIEKYKDGKVVLSEFSNVIKKQNDIIKAIEVKTPLKSFDLMVNSRLLYQAYKCRMTARTGFYQSSGAFGFRDQLQDSLSLMYSAPLIARNQILLHAAHQFEEGDVLHWWHKGEGETDKGVRTRFADDRLWLCYLVCDYIEITGDKSILEEKVPYINDAPLKDGENERYTHPLPSQLTETLLKHCQRAIECSLETGEHGLPLIGGGDWNDGMNNVGIEGKGESVWLAWFFADVLTKFSKYTDRETARKYKEHADKISKAANEAWDGAWYRRAYFDNGAPLGSSQNQECSIDSISQSWSVISEKGNKELAKTAMESVEKLLVDYSHGFVKLLAPPFDKSVPNPGYIQSYLPGIRENGGQYTHAAVWTGIAFAVLGDGDKAMRIFELINPVNHSNVNLIANIYKTEPYALAADIYSTEPHVGRGGWTWYTGAASWMYRFAIEYLLGFKKTGNAVHFKPCVPADWDEFEFKYKFKSSEYVFLLKRGDEKSGEIKLLDDGKTHKISIFF